MFYVLPPNADGDQQWVSIEHIVRLEHLPRVSMLNVYMSDGSKHTVRDAGIEQLKQHLTSKGFF